MHAIWHQFGRVSSDCKSVVATYMSQRTILGLLTCDLVCIHKQSMHKKHCVAHDYQQLKTQGDILAYLFGVTYLGSLKSYLPVIKSKSYTVVPRAKATLASA